MRTRRAFLVTAGALAAAGCTSTGQNDDGTERPTATPARATDTPAETSVEYVLRAGRVSDELASATATVEAVFVEDTDGLGPCTRDVYFGPYKPTPTPIGTPTAGCNRSRAESIDLTSVDERTHEAAAPETAAAHAFVATAVVGTDEGGNEITEIFGTGGAVLVKAETAPSGPYGVEVGVEADDDASDYDHAVTTERFDPDA